MDELVLWLWLSLAITPGSSTFPRLLERFSGAREIYEANEYEIRRVIGTRSSDFSRLCKKELDKARAVLDFCTSRGVGILKYDDPEFPGALRHIASPPVLLYYRGTLPCFDRDFFCAVVGTRRLSDSGRRNAFRLGYDLASAGSVVVSGMALGIDGVAMAGAISAGGRTVAVIGSGIDICYPKEHLTLAREIVKNGCVFTEYALGTPALSRNFPRRNRIISGLCPACVIVEGRERSGALITARCAKAEKRTLYAFPGRVEDGNSQATNLLIKSGAKLCTGADDIINDFEPHYRGIINPFLLKERPDVEMNSALSEFKVSATAPSDGIFRPKHIKKSDAVKINTEEPKKSSHPELHDAEREVYGAIPEIDGCPLEELVSEERDLRSVMRVLLKLEMKGLIEMLPGERVRRT